MAIRRATGHHKEIRELNPEKALVKKVVAVTYLVLSDNFIPHQQRLASTSSESEELGLERDSNRREHMRMRKAQSGCG